MHGDVVPAADAARSAGDAVLRALVDVSGAGLAVLDAEGRFTAFNPVCAEILGVAPAALIGSPSPFSADGAGTAGWTAPGGRRRELDYRRAPAGEGHVVWFCDVTDARRQQERLAAIVRAAASVADAGSLRATLDAVAQEIAKTTTIAAVQILAVGDPRDELRVLGMAGFGEFNDVGASEFIERLSACRRRGARVRFLDALASGAPVVVPHRKPVIMADPAWEPLHEIMDAPDWDGFVSAPVVARGRSVGVINAYYRPGEHPGPSSLAFLTAMADHAAVAVDTAALLDRTRSRAQLAERRRLARDLHDSVVQQLFSMRMQASALRSRLGLPDADPTEVGESAQELVELSQSALADLRRLVFEVRPLDLVEGGLIDAVRAHARSLQARTGLTVDIAAPTGPDVGLDLQHDAQEDVPRIVQEALHNVVKHAHASTVRICLSPPADGAGGLVVEVADDGHPDPADVAAPRPSDQLGLVSMRERAQRWGGQLSAGRRPDGGWTVRVTLPATAEAAR